MCSQLCNATHIPPQQPVIAGLGFHVTTYQLLFLVLLALSYVKGPALLDDRIELSNLHPPHLDILDVSVWMGNFENQLVLAVLLHYFCVFLLFYKIKPVFVRRSQKQYLL